MPRGSSPGLRSVGSDSLSLVRGCSLCFSSGFVSGGLRARFGRSAILPFHRSLAPVEDFAAMLRPGWCRRVRSDVWENPAGSHVVIAGICRGAVRAEGNPACEWGFHSVRADREVHWRGYLPRAADPAIRRCCVLRGAGLLFVDLSIMGVAGGEIAKTGIALRQVPCPVAREACPVAVCIDQAASDIARPSWIGRRKRERWRVIAPGRGADHRSDGEVMIHHIFTNVSRPWGHRRAGPRGLRVRCTEGGARSRHRATRRTTRSATALAT